MPPPEDAPRPASVTVHLPELEPVLGLVAACMRLCMSLTPEVNEVMPDAAQDALTQIQSILWRVEHAQVERVPDGG